LRERRFKMEAQYSFTRVEPLMDRTTENVISWVVGLSATFTEKPEIGAYIDAEVPVPEGDQRPLENWSEAEIRHFALTWAVKEDPETGKQNWFNQLKVQLEAQLDRPIRGTSIVI